MMKNKSFDEIRPARGTKIPKKTKIIQNVQSPSISIPPPSEEVAKFTIEGNRIRDSLMDAMRSINKLMNERVLPENKSLREKEEETKAVTNLVDAAKLLENINPGEGLLGMAILAIRQGFSLRDAGNQLASELRDLKFNLQDLIKQVNKLNDDIDKKIDK
jgi:hypothetical protein